MKTVVNRLIYDTTTGRYLARSASAERVESLFVSPAFAFFVHRLDRQEGERIIEMDRGDVLAWLDDNGIDRGCVAGYMD